MLHDEELVIQRVIKMVKDGTVVSINGREIPIQAHSICVHGDNPDALAFVSRIRNALEREGISISNLRDIVG